MYRARHAGMSNIRLQIACMKKIKILCKKYVFVEKKYICTKNIQYTFAKKTS